MFILKKLLAFFLSLFFIITLTFLLLKVLPGNPFIGEAIITPEAMDSLCTYFGLNDPWWVQYLRYIKGFFLFDFGPSMIYSTRSARDVILEGFPITALLGLQALFFSLFAGILLGVLTSFYRSKRTDTMLMTIAAIGISLPNFVVATLLQYFFALKLHIFPVARWGSYLHTILPAISLSIMPTAYFARLIRTSMIEVLSQEYIKAAYAKGLSSAYILLRHALPNALFPLVSYLAPLLTYLITGSFTIEKIFGIPGLGQWMISSIFNRDYSMIMGLIVFYSMILIASNFMVDILYRLINPRIKFQIKPT